MAGVEKAIIGFMLTLVLILAITIPMAIGGCNKICDEVGSKGMKAVVSNVWEGTNDVPTEPLSPITPIGEGRE